MWQFIMQGIKKPTDSGNGSSSSSTLPNLNNPNISTNISGPNVSGPSISGPNITTPSISGPNISAPSITTPNVSLPSVNLSNLPSVQVPDLNIQAPSVDLSQLGLPSLPSLSLPGTPTIDLPSTGGLGYSNGNITYTPTAGQALNTAEDIAGIAGQTSLQAGLAALGPVAAWFEGGKLLEDLLSNTLYAGEGPKLTPQDYVNTWTNELNSGLDMSQQTGFEANAWKDLTPDQQQQIQTYALGKQIAGGMSPDKLSQAQSTYLAGNAVNPALVSYEGWSQPTAQPTTTPSGQPVDIASSIQAAIAAAQAQAQAQAKGG